MTRFLATLAAAVVATLALPGVAAACSRDDRSWFDGFPDDSCLLGGYTNVETDTLGGLRLGTNGSPVTATWNTRTELEDGLTYESELFAPVDRSSLEVVGPSDATAALELPMTTMPLTSAGEPVLGPTASTWLDSDGVRDPSVVKVGSQYVMYYTGLAEDGSGPAIFRLVSSSGTTTWTRPADPSQHLPVLSGTADAFDEHGVYGADVVYDPADAEAPYKMWYSGAGDTYTQIGYATSTDGIAWTKHDSDDLDALPDPVVAVGLPGSQDAFSAAHPTVLVDGGLWKMFYEGDDSTKKSIAYATSTDGLTWSKAGAVIESGSGNVEFGVFAPTVWKDPSDTQKPFKMLVGGRKETQQGSGVFQTKLIAASSADGLDWTLGNIALNTASFAASNLSSPEVLPEGTAIKLYYSGNRANEDDPRDRIGYAAGTGGTAQTMALDIAPRSTLLDAREAFDLAAADPGGTPDELAGVYVGLKEDGLPRLGAARSDTDGTTWTKVPLTGDTPVIPLGANNNQFDQDGHRDPHLLYAQNAGGNPATDYFLFFTGIDDGVETIGLTTASEVAVTSQPDHTTWANPGNNAHLGLGASGQFDEAGVSHPSVVGVAGNSVMYYTGRNGAGTTTLGRAVASSPDGTYGSRQAITLNAAPAGTPADACDKSGRRDPEAVTIDGVVHLLFTGLQLVEGATIERTCWARATSSGETIAFDRMGPVLNPSQSPHALDESAIAPSSIVNDGGAFLRVFTNGTGRDGRIRAGYAATPLPLSTSATVSIPNGWATYQLGDADTPVRDFQQIAASATGTGIELWMSVLQPYSTAGTPYWSDFFPVDAVGAGQELNFQLGASPGEGVRAVRWQARLRRAEQPEDAPHLDEVAIDHADVSFFPSGTATTTDITPPDEFTLQRWTSLTLTTSLFQPLGTGSASGTVTVLNDAGATVVAASPITLPGTTTVSLAGVNAASHPKLRVRLDLASTSGEASPLVQSLKVEYSALAPGSAPPPPPPPPPPPLAPVLTLATSTPRIVFGRSGTLSGTVTQAGAGLAGRGVTVFAQPRGATAPVAVGSATTDSAGTWSLSVKPLKQTAYTASFGGATAPTAVTIAVKHRLSLKLRIVDGKVLFQGAIGPKHRRRAVTIQRKAGGRWRRLVTVRTSRRATFRYAKRFAEGRHSFRALTPRDADHLAGRSAARRIRVR
jgi:predicted GH43/DUF377 family glycosyl hydrolase